MFVHPFAYDHMMAKKVQYLQENWQYLALLTHPETGYKLHYIDTAEDAAALIAIVATDPLQIELFSEGQSRSILGMDNDGRCIETMAALYQYQFEDVQGAMKIITAHLLAQDPQNLSLHDQALLHYTMSAAAFKVHSLFEPDDLIKLADFCVLYDQADYQSPNQKIGESHFPAKMTIGALIAKLRENHENDALLDTCKSYLPYLMADTVHRADCIEEGIYLIEMLDQNSKLESEVDIHKESIEHFIASKFNYLMRIGHADTTTRLERLFPQIAAQFEGFIREYSAQPDPTGRPPKTPHP